MTAVWIIRQFTEKLKNGSEKEEVKVKQRAGETKLSF